MHKLGGGDHCSVSNRENMVDSGMILPTDRFYWQWYLSVTRRRWLIPMICFWFIFSYPNPQSFSHHRCPAWARGNGGTCALNLVANIVYLALASRGESWPQTLPCPLERRRQRMRTATVCWEVSWSAVKFVLWSFCCSLPRPIGIRHPVHPTSIYALGYAPWKIYFTSSLHFIHSECLFISSCDSISMYFRII